MKKLFLILLLATTCYVSNAQSRGSGSGLSLGIEAGLPLGQYGKIYSAAIGGNLQYEARPASDVGITINGGYLHYPVKSKYGGGSTGFIPLMGGVKYYFSPMAFFHAQLGAAIGTGKGQGTSFAYSPGIGIKFSPNVDAELKYMGISNKGGTIDNLGIRLGFNF